MRGEERRPLETVIRVRPGGALGGPPGPGRERRSVRFVVGGWLLGTCRAETCRRHRSETTPLRPSPGINARHRRLDCSAIGFASDHEEFVLEPARFRVPYTIFKEFAFSSAHHIPGHPGKCRFLHGHNYRVRVFVRADTLDSIGMVLDFARLKALTEEEIGHFDHKVINDFPPFDTVSPTAEELAGFVYERLSARLDDEPGCSERGVSVARVEVWENTTSCAIYEP